MRTLNEQQYVMAIDEGTTSTRAIIFDHDGNKVAMSQQEFPSTSLNQGGLNMTQWRFGMLSSL